LNIFPLDELTKLGYEKLDNANLAYISLAIERDKWETLNPAELTLGYFVDLKVSVIKEDGNASIEPVFFRKLHKEPDMLDIPVDATANAEAFDDTVFLNYEYLQDFYDTLTEYAVEWKSVKLKYYAPLAAVINASMMGKSRMISELRTLGVFVITFCFRDSPNRHYRPRQSGASLVEWAGKSKSELRDFSNQCCIMLFFSLAKLEKFLQEQRKAMKTTHSLQSLAQEWYLLTEDPSFSEEIYEIMKVNARPEGFQGNDLTYVHDLAVAWQKKMESMRKSLTELLESMVTKEEAAEIAEHVRVVFAFDEARRLNVNHSRDARFVWLRRMMRILSFSDKQGILMFCLATDTTSKLANLPPAKSGDPSLRVNRGGMGLFPPFTFIRSIDVWWNTIADTRISSRETEAAILTKFSNAWKKDSGSTLGEPTNKKGNAGAKRTLRCSLTLSLLQNPEIMARFGRPFYYGFFKARLEKFFESNDEVREEDLHTNEFTLQSSQSLLSLLEMKILGGGMAGKKIDSLEKKTASGMLFTKAQALAVLGSIVSLEISAHTEMASELASEHMRILAAISDDRKCVYTLEVSEPFLALAAHLIITSKVVPWEVLLDKLSLASLRSTTSIGFKGEVAAMILCLMAWQSSLRWPVHDFPSVEANVFLNRLLGKLWNRSNRQTQPLDVEMSSNESNGDVEMAEGNVDSVPLPQATLEDVEKALEGCYVRLNQFVKTFVDVTPEMLVENFIRSTGIACRENSTDGESLIPFVRLSSTTVQEENTSAIVVQANLYAMSDHALHSLFASVKSRSYLRTHLPVIAILFDFRPLSSGSSRESVQVFRIPETVKGFAILCRHPTPADILDTLDDLNPLNGAFVRLLESNVNPNKSRNVSARMREGILKMFHSQPYGRFPESQSSNMP
jgi:hypothetical protein